MSLIAEVLLHGGSPAPDVAAPLSAVDRTWTDPTGALVAEKLVVADDPYLEGHYPDGVIFPGVFSLETALQATAQHLRALRPGADYELTTIDSVRFTAPFRPGDVLRATIEVGLDDRSGTALVRCRCAGRDGADRATMRLRFTLRGTGPVA